MAETDYMVTNTSIVSPSSVLNDEQGLDVPPWEAMSISQVLLPVLCGMFIAGVIVVIACCLIQKKAKSHGVVRQKSSHTIETLHEASDHDIYDVIEEIRAKSPDKYQRRNDKLDTPNMLRPPNLPHSELTNLFANKSGAISLHCPSKFDLLASKMSVRNARDWTSTNRGSVANDSRLSTNTEGGVSNVSNDDDGIYETLDRHWNFRNEQSDKAAIQISVKAIIQNQIRGCQGNVSDGGHNNSNVSDDAKTRDSSDSNNGGLILDTSSQSKETKRLLCQINMFEIANGDDNPTLLETSYYRVNSPISSKNETNVATISGVFQSSSLRILPGCTRDTNLTTDLILQALKDDDALPKNLRDIPICRSPQPNKQEKPTKTYEKLHRSNSKRFPFLTVKKSESFRTPGSELQTAKEQRRLHRRKSDSSDIENHLACARTPTKQANISTGPEVTRILTKLGPLPPVPCLSQVKNEKSATHKSVHAVTPSPTSSGSVLDAHKLSSLPVSNKNFQTMCPDKVDILSSIPSTDELHLDADKDSSCVTGVSNSPTIISELDINYVSTGRGDLKNMNLNSESETNTDSDTTSTGSACIASTDSVCGNIMASDREDDVSNYYFVLESMAGTSSCSSRNSGINGSLDCETKAATDNGRTHSSPSPNVQCNSDEQLRLGLNLV